MDMADDEFRRPCLHCHGLGLDPDKGVRRQRGRRISWTFQLADNCPICKGTGFLPLPTGVNPEALL